MADMALLSSSISGSEQQAPEPAHGPARPSLLLGSSRLQLPCHIPRQNFPFQMDQRGGRGELHHARRIAANHALGPPSLKLKSFRSGRTSYLAGSTDSMTQRWAKAS